MKTRNGLGSGIDRQTIMRRKAREPKISRKDQSTKDHGPEVLFEEIAIDLLQARLSGVIRRKLWQASRIK